MSKGEKMKSNLSAGCLACKEVLMDHQILETNLNISKISAKLCLAGHNPKTILDAASSALSFWSYQKKHEYLDMKRHLEHYRWVLHLFNDFLIFNLNLFQNKTSKPDKAHRRLDEGQRVPLCSLAGWKREARHGEERSEAGSHRQVWRTSEGQEVEAWRQLNLKPEASFSLKISKKTRFRYLGGNKFM